MSIRALRGQSFGFRPHNCAVHTYRRGLKRPNLTTLPDLKALGTKETKAKQSTNTQSEF